MRKTDAPYPDEVTRRVFEAIEASGISQARIAEAMGRHRQTVTNWRNNGVPHRALESLTPLLDVTYNYLRDGESPDSVPGAPAELDADVIRSILDRVDRMGRAKGQRVGNSDRARAIADHYNRVANELQAAMDRAIPDSALFDNVM